jgi:hypothetical protein
MCTHRLFVFTPEINLFTLKLNNLYCAVKKSHWTWSVLTLTWLHDVASWRLRRTQMTLTPIFGIWQANAIYPLGTPARDRRKHVWRCCHHVPYGIMMFPFPSLGWPGAALSTKHATQLSTRHPRWPFIQMTDADVTLLPNYNNMDLARSHVMILISPPPLSCFQL